MPVLTFYNHKGGVGKSTALLGLALAAPAPVSVVDLDPQQTTANWLTSHTLNITLLSRIPAQAPGLTLIDTPRLDLVRASEGLRRADLVIVPVRPSLIDWHVAKLTLRSVTEAGKLAAWLPSQVDARRAGDRDFAASLVDVMKSGEIPTWPILPPIRNSSVAHYLEGRAPSSAAAADFRAVWLAVKGILRKAGVQQ